MLVICRYFWQICLFREGPEKIPKSVPIALTLLLIYLCVALTATSLINPEQTLSHAILAVGVGSGIEISFLFGLLIFKSVGTRFLSTLSALLGSNTLFLILLLPINLVLKQIDPGIGNTFFQTLWMLSFFWWLMIVGFIFHRAANISLLQGTILAFIIELLAILAITQLQPSSSGT